MYPGLGELGVTIAPVRRRGLTPGAMGRMRRAVPKPVVWPVAPRWPLRRPVKPKPKLVKPVAKPKRPVTLPRRIMPPPILCARGWVNVGGRCVYEEPPVVTRRVAPPKPRPKLPPKNGKAVPGMPPMPKPTPAPPALSVVAPGGGGAVPGGGAAPAGRTTASKAPAGPGWVIPAALGVAALVFLGGR